MNAFLNSLYASTALFAAPDAPVSPRGNGEDPTPMPDPDTIFDRKRSDKAKAKTESSADAMPPPPMPDQAQDTTHKLNLDAIRKNRAQVTPQVSLAVRIPVIDRLNSEYFFRVHPTFGGLDDPMPIWQGGGVGGKRSGARLVDPIMVEPVRAQGGKVCLSALYWGRYSAGAGQFVAVVNIESDNDWPTSKRQVLELARTGWFKMINAGNCWDKIPAPAPIPDIAWPDLTWDQVLGLAFDNIVADENHPDFRSLVYGGAAAAAAAAS
jgi:hypothetical protein